MNTCHFPGAVAAVYLVKIRTLLMKNASELHADHTELTSDIVFLKKEIDFLLKLLRNAYSISVNMEKIKLLDAYWKGFEQNIARLEELLGKIKKEENQLAALCQENLIDGEKTYFNEEETVSAFYKLNKEVRVLKESFYEYMSGCCACSYKTNLSLKDESSCL
jgi:hypothetical protein